MQLSLQQQLDTWVWHTDLNTLPGWQRRLTRAAQILLMVLRDFSSGMITLRAMSLVYTTLLSFVPLLAVSFSVLKGFGVHNQIEPMLLHFLEPLGEKSIDITRNIVGFVDNMKIGVLGALGLGMLIYTVVSLIQKIESAFNYTWRLSSTRNLSQRFSNYLSVIMVGPVLVFSAVGITASLKSHTIINTIQSLPYAGDVLHLVGLLLPYVLIIAAFTFVYILVPNTRVKFKSALYGAIVAGILWRWTGALFASFASGSTSYTAIYSGFAILLLFMIWLYLGWLILLIGASISYYHQHPERLRWKSENPEISGLMRENLSLQLMLEIGTAHYRGEASKTSLPHLIEHLKLPESMILRMLNQLLDCGLLLPVTDSNGQYLPARSIDQISLYEIVRMARLAEDLGMSEQMRCARPVKALQQDIDQCLQSALQQKTLKDLVVDTLESKT